MPYLVLMDGASQGRQISLAIGSTRIGRVDGNDVVIDNPSVSSAHAELDLSASGCILRDLKSTNGTRVNGQPIVETRLFRDDSIMFGDMTAVFTGADAPSRATPAEPPADVVSALSTRPPVVVASAANGQHTTAVCPPDFRKKRDMRLIWLIVVVVLLVLIIMAAYRFIQKVF